MGKTKQKKWLMANIFNTPLRNFTGGLCLFALAYALFSVALGSGSYWQWTGCFVAFGLGLNRMLTGFHTFANR